MREAANYVWAHIVWSRSAFAHNLFRVITCCHIIWSLIAWLRRLGGVQRLYTALCPGFTAAVLSNRLCASAHMYKCGTVVQTLEYASPAPTAPLLVFVSSVDRKSAAATAAVGLSAS
jgi:hypothetical protein